MFCRAIYRDGATPFFNAALLLVGSLYLKRAHECLIETHVLKMQCEPLSSKTT